jgi:hypothetical protein
MDTELLTGMPKNNSPSARVWCKRACILFVVLLVSVGIYLGVVLGTASIPKFQVLAAALSPNFDQRAIQGNVTVSITNPNKIPFSIRADSFPAYYPATASSENQIGVFAVPVIQCGVNEQVTAVVASNVNAISLVKALLMSNDYLFKNGVSVLFAKTVEVEAVLFGFVPVTKKVDMQCTVVLHPTRATEVACSFTVP